MAIKQYRTEYPGEFVVTHTVFKAGKKEQTREWIGNPIKNDSINNRACCIAPGHSIVNFSLKLIENHRGGLLSRNKMQLYAVEETWERMAADFHIVQKPDTLKDIITANFQVDNIVYTSTKQCVANPEQFFLIPHGVSYSSSATAVWLACFDGHKDIYLFGYNENDVHGNIQHKMIAAVADIIKTFDDVNFYHVSNSSSPDAWRRCVNLQTISQREFVSYCDI